MRFFLALGLVGMTLSEAGSWNLRAFASAVAAKGPLAALPGVVAALLVYTLLLALLFDASERTGARDAAGLLLLSSLYGLANEGLFAPHLAAPAALNPIFLLFPTLSWHAYLDGALTVLVARAYLGGRLDLSQPGLSLREAGFVASACALWFPWSHAPWLPPAPPGVFVFFLLAPFALLALIVPGGGPLPAPGIPPLPPRARRAMYALLAAVAFGRATQAPAGMAVWGLLCLVYAALFRVTRPRPAALPDAAGPSGQAAAEAASHAPQPPSPAGRPISRGKILHAALLSLILFASWRAAVAALGLAPLLARGCSTAAVAAGITLPLATLLLAARAILRGMPVRRG